MYLKYWEALVPMVLFSVLGSLTQLFLGLLESRTRQSSHPATQ